MGLFEDVGIAPAPAEGSTPAAPRVDLTVELKERAKTGGLAAGGGVSAAAAPADGGAGLPGFIGTASYSQRNLLGLGQRLVASAEVGAADSTFRVAHTDPWVRGDAFRPSRTHSAQTTRTSAAAIHGRAQDEADAAAAAGGGGAEGGGGGGAAAALKDGVLVSRVVSAVEYARPLALGWQGSLGLSWQTARCVDEAGRPLARDCYGSPLSAPRPPADGDADAAGGAGAGASAAASSAGSSPRGGGAAAAAADAPPGRDTMALATIRVAYAAPDGGAGLAASMEQAVPLVGGWLNFNRFSLRADGALPLPAGVRLWACAKGGAVVGDLPPYEAFPIGGTNSVRGYAEGGVGTGRRFAAATAELHFPLLAPVEGTLFADVGSDLGSGALVPGDPAGARQKPGAGWGAGAGVRLETPIGPLRLECALSDAGRRRFHLGVGAHG
jgi:outer membrane protein insertion porin family